MNLKYSIYFEELQIREITIEESGNVLRFRNKSDRDRFAPR